MKFWVEDRLVPADQARVHILDRGFTVADGVFETLKTVRTTSSEIVPFAADRHIARLVRAAHGMGLPAPDVEMVKVAMLAVCAANQEYLREGGRLRVSYTGGAGPLGSVRAGNPGPPTLVVASGPMRPSKSQETLALVPWPRNERSPLVGIKCMAYAENVRMLAYARSLGAGEALLRNLTGALCEGTGSNLFLVLADDDRASVVTPDLASGALGGVTRELVLEWGSAAGLPVRTDRLELADLGQALGCFLTSSTRDVQQVDVVLDESGAPLVTFPQVGAGADVIGELAGIFAHRTAAQPNP